MFDIGFTELLVIGVVALIVVGPKDLPGMFRTLGRFTARARQMAREFSQAMNEAADESGVQDVAKTLKGVTNPKAMGLDALNKAADGFEKWDPAKALRDQKAADAATKTPDLSQERAEVARKIHETTAKATTEKQAKEAAQIADGPTDPVAKKTAPKKQAPKKQAPVKRATGKGTAGKAAASKSTQADATTPASKSPAAKRSAAKKPASGKATAKKPAAKKTAGKSAAKPAAKTAPKSAAKKPAAPKTAAKKTAAKKVAPKPSDASDA